MIRILLCPKCGADKPLPAEDVAMGWHQRRTELRVQMLPGMEPTGLMCDKCAVSIPGGSDAVALTMYRGPEPELWELEYLAVTK